MVKQNSTCHFLFLALQGYVEWFKRTPLCGPGEKWTEGPVSHHEPQKRFSVQPDAVVHSGSRRAFFSLAASLMAQSVEHLAITQPVACRVCRS